MCLVVVAHRASERFPLVIAANRDEDYARATHDAHFWTDTPEVLGGRDAVANGSWLAITRSGRFAAVTNLMGTERQTRSRGALVRDFVVGTVAPLQYAQSILPVANQYAGFHLFTGIAGGEAVYMTPQSQTVMRPGIQAVSNAPVGQHWPKVDYAVEEMSIALRMDDAETIMLVLLQFLALPRGTDSVQNEVFIKGDRYGTRASTVIVVTETEVLFGEQSFARGGEPYCNNCLLRIELAP
ncbi:MAG TPA: NRDE family protein [Thermoanaerobaculia bacterium]|nr:NRDE family protein [Thermoanaerobaculia bacterium]